jgi:hypothetical protein
MRRCAAVVAAIAACSSAALVAPSAPSAAAASCTYIPELPHRLPVGRSFVPLNATIAVAGSADCRHYFDATTQAVHGADSYLLWWTDSARRASQSIEGYTIVPGTYRTASSGCAAYDAARRPLPCVVAPATTVIKYAGRAVLRLHRSGERVYFHVSALRWFPSQDYRGVAASVRLQRWADGEWRTIHETTTTARSGYRWSYRHAASARYRAVSAELPAAFGAASHPFAI